MFVVDVVVSIGLIREDCSSVTTGATDEISATYVPEDHLLSTYPPQNDDSSPISRAISNFNTKGNDDYIDL